MAYTKKKLKELNVIDDFLMNRLASDKEVGEEFCRVILSTLLQRKIGKVKVTVQKVLPPGDPTLKGVRLDVKVEEPLVREEDGIGEGTAMNIYDIEPHLVEGTDLPRHNRFYQALSDSSNLKSGETDYRHLPDLYILMILDKDPFGYDYMMYSIRHKCEEVDSVFITFIQGVIMVEMKKLKQCFVTLGTAVKKMQRMLPRRRSIGLRKK